MDTSQLIDNRIAELADWRGQRLAELRTLIRGAAPEMVEEWKWDTPVWSSNGNVVAFGAFKDHVKLNFFHGALLDDPQHLFNAGLEAKATRAIDFYEKDKVNETALKDLVRAAAAANQLKSRPANSKAKNSSPKKKATASSTTSKKTAKTK